MALDVVEIVMRTEEVFGINIDETDAGKISTVGDLYEAVCNQLDASPNSDSGGFALVSARRDGSLGVQTLDHPPDEIWVKLVAIISDQLQVNPEEVRYDSRFGQGLGAD
jgi:acyl carrier protein